MEFVDLKASVKKEKGKEANKKLRAKGLVPAVVYKQGEEAVSLKIDNKGLLVALHSGAGENAIIRLHIDEVVKGKERTVMVKEIQKDPIKDCLLHVDFFEISLTDALQVKVPIVSKGEAIGVKQEQGVLQQVLWEAEIECLPTNIPKKIEVDIIGLKVGEAIHVKDIVSPIGVRILDDSEAVVFSIEHARSVEDLIAEPEEGGTQEPEVIREKKEIDEDAEAAAPKEEKKADDKA